jgi:hypothetical protein
MEDTILPDIISVTEALLYSTSNDDMEKETSHDPALTAVTTSGTDTIKSAGISTVCEFAELRTVHTEGAPSTSVTVIGSAGVVEARSTIDVESMIEFPSEAFWSASAR